MLASYILMLVHLLTVEATQKTQARIQLQPKKAIGLMSAAGRAVYDESDSLLKSALRSGADVNARYNDGGTLLLYAVERKSKHMVGSLLDSGARINEMDGFGTTPLFLASQTGQFETVRLLIERGADINLRNPSTRSTALSVAIEQRHQRIAEYLIRHNASTGVHP